MTRQWHLAMNIAQKLRILLMVGAFFSIVIFSGIYTYLGVHSMRANLLQDAINTTTLMGSRVVAAIRFNNPGFATKKLGVLATNAAIKRVCIYDAAGKPFAGYPHLDCARQRLLWNGSFKESSQVLGGNILITRNILADGEIIGSITITRAQPEIPKYVMLQLKTMSAVTAICLFCIFFVVNYLQKWVSAPIVEIANNAQQIFAKQTFQDRIERKSHDELGQLAEAFNNVLHYMDHRHQNLLKSFQSLTNAHESTLQKLQQLAEDFREPADSFIIFSQMTASQLLGPEVNNYAEYQADVMEALTEYHIKLSSFTRLTNLYAKSLQEKPTLIDLKSYLRDFVVTVQQTLPYLKTETLGDLAHRQKTIEFEIRLGAWDEIFRSLASIINTLIGIVEFVPELQFHYLNNSLQITFMEESAKPRSESFLSLCKLTQDGEGDYVRNSIDDPAVADEFLDQEKFPRPYLKYILDSIAYIASANSIWINHQFEYKKFAITLDLTNVNPSLLTNDHLKAVK